MVRVPEKFIYWFCASISVPTVIPYSSDSSAVNVEHPSIVKQRQLPANLFDSTIELDFEIQSKAEHEEFRSLVEAHVLSVNCGLLAIVNYKLLEVV